MAKPRLHLPTVKISPVITQRDADTPHETGRDPGFFRWGCPFCRAGILRRCKRRRSAWLKRIAERPRSARPPLRSMMEPAAATARARRLDQFEDLSRAAASGDDVFRPIGHLPGRMEKPRRSVIFPAFRSVKMNSAAECAGLTSCPMINPLDGGRRTTTSAGPTCAARLHPRRSAISGGAGKPIHTEDIRRRQAAGQTKVTFQGTLPSHETPAWSLRSRNQL